jgi:hypothetical protein
VLDAKGHQRERDVTCGPGRAYVDPVDDVVTAGARQPLDRTGEHIELDVADDVQRTTHVSVQLGVVLVVSEPTDRETPACGETSTQQLHRQDLENRTGHRHVDGREAQDREPVCPRDVGSCGQQ